MLGISQSCSGQNLGWRMALSLSLSALPPLILSVFMFSLSPILSFALSLTLSFWCSLFLCLSRSLCSPSHPSLSLTLSRSFCHTLFLSDIQFPKLFPVLPHSLAADEQPRQDVNDHERREEDRAAEDTHEVAHLREGKRAKGKWGLNHEVRMIMSDVREIAAQKTP